MKVKFFDSNNQMRFMVLDDSTDAVKKKELVNHYGKKLVEQELAKVNQKEVFGSSKKYLDFMQHLEEFNQSNPDRLCERDFKWDNEMFYNYDNRGKNNPYKKLRIGGIYKLDCYKDGGFTNTLVTEDGSKTIVTLRGRQSAFKDLFQGIADEVNKGFAIPKDGLSGAFNQEEYLQMKKEETQDTLNKIEDLEEDIEQLEMDIEDGMCEELRNQSEEECKKELEEKKLELQKAQKHLEEIESEDFNPMEEHYTAEDIMELTKSEDIPEITPIDLDYNSLFDPQPYFGNNDVKLKFDYEDSKFVKDGLEFDYFEVEKGLKNEFNKCKKVISYEDWLRNNHETMNKVVDSLKPRKENSMNNLKFRFSDGTIIEVLEDDNKSFAQVKDEAIKVYNELKAKDSEKETKEALEEFDAKATNDSVAQEAEKETKEVLEEFDAKATNDSLAGIAMGLGMNSAKEAIQNGVSREEWLKTMYENFPEAEEGWFEGLWDHVEKEMNDESYAVNDEIKETSDDVFEVTVNGKVIGTFDTLEEAQEAEKKALEAIEKGIPKPTNE